MPRRRGSSDNRRPLGARRPSFACGGTFSTLYKDTAVCRKTMSNTPRRQCLPHPSGQMLTLKPQPPRLFAGFHKQHTVKEAQTAANRSPGIRPSRHLFSKDEQSTTAPPIEAAAAEQLCNALAKQARITLSFQISRRSAARSKLEKDLILDRFPYRTNSSRKLSDMVGVRI